MNLRIHNTLSRSKEAFAPIDPANVRMYVCGPTVYDFAHIGNARPAIVFDVLYRLLRHIYGAEHVTYVRNITDVDDKIIARALEDGVEIDELTWTTADQYHADVRALGCLEPDIEPRATQTIPEMVAMIETLIAGGAAYAADGHVLFDVPGFSAYGELSGRSTDEMIAGARVEVAPYKKSPMDFVLWKPSSEDQPGWDSPWGRGRPGWHIECSAMAEKHLGKVFDIHGGGIDLAFPHHENEIAQSRSAHGSDSMANYWMHNGFLQVEGEKMSKSLGNFFTIRELLDTDHFGARKWPGAVLRLAMLMTHYRQPIDWTVARTETARQALIDWIGSAGTADTADTPPSPLVIEALADDLNTPRAVTILHALCSRARKGDPDAGRELGATLGFLGLWDGETVAGIRDHGRKAGPELSEETVRPLIDARNAARAAKNFAEADLIRDKLAAMGVALKDGPDGTSWEPAP